MKNNQDDKELFERDYDRIRQITPPSGAPAPGTGRPGRSRKKGARRAKGSSRAAGAGRLLSLLLALAIGLSAGLGGGYFLWGVKRTRDVDLKAIQAPSWIQQEFIRKNIFSRPDVSMREVNNIVIHYVANPGSSAEMNRRYFDSLADQDPEESGTSASSHFIVGLDGEIIQCIPVSEVAYANAPRNNDTVSIEVCHPDESGVFNDESYNSLVKLTAWLCEELELSARDVIRHYDVNGKNCPRSFVENEDAWKQFRKDVKKAIQK